MMDTRFSPQISCALCSRTVDLQADLCADENGKAVHEDCYFKHVARNSLVDQQIKS
jgi:hypothetical protein